MTGIIEGYKNIMHAKNRIELLIDESNIVEVELIDIKRLLEHGLYCIEGGYIETLMSEAVDEMNIETIPEAV